MTTTTSLWFGASVGYSAAHAVADTGWTAALWAVVASAGLVALLGAVGDE